MTYASHDLGAYYLPVYHAFYGAMAAGRLPLWNPDQLCGVPWLASLEGGPFYPPHALYLLFPTRIALALSGLLHLGLAAVTTAALARKLGIGAAGATIAAMLFALRGVLPSFLLWPHLLEAAAWLPLGCVAVVDVARGTGRRGAALLAFAAGMSVLASCPQMTVYLAYVWGTLLAAALLARRATGRTSLVAAGWLAVGVGVGILVGALALLPATEVAWLGTRGVRRLAVEQMYPTGQLGLAILWQAVAGSHRSFGPVALSLAPAALLATRHRGIALWALAVGVLTFVFALGPATPLFRLYLALPAIGTFREPPRSLFVVDFCLALLAGIALDAILRERRRAVVSLVVAIILTVFLVRRDFWLDAIVAGGMAAALVAASVKQTRAAFVSAACVALAAAHVMAATWAREHLPYDAASAAAALLDHADTYRALGRDQGSDRVWVVRRDPSPKLATVHGVRAVDDYAGLTLRRQAEYFTYAIEGSTVSSNPNRLYRGHLIVPPPVDGGSPLAARRRLLDAAAVRLVAIDDAVLATPTLRTFVAQAELVRTGSPEPHVTLFENRHALPRAFITYRVLPAPPPDALLARLSAPEFDPLAESFVEGDADLPATAERPSRGAAAVIVRDEPGVVELDVTAVAPGLVVLADTFVPGWEATVDGTPTPILATNHLFRGVRVASGRHGVHFVYRPGLGGPLTLSLAGIAATVALLRRARARPASP